MASGGIEINYSWVGAWNELCARLPVAAFTTSFLIATVTIIWLLTSLSTHFRPSGKGRLPPPPGSFGFPVIGETVQFILASRGDVTYREWMRKKVKQYGPVFKTHFLGSPTIIMDPPVGNKFLFQNEGKMVENYFPKPLASLFGPDWLGLKVGDEHRIVRRQFASLLDHVAVIRYLEGLDRDASKHFATDWDGKDGLSALDCIKKFTFTTMCNLLMTLDHGPEVNELGAAYEKWALGLLNLPINLPGFAYHDALTARKYILEILDKVVAIRRLELAEDRVSERAKVDVLNRLLTEPDETGRFLPDPAIKDNLLGILFAGFDTSSVTLAMTIYFIARNPHVYPQLVQEHKSIVERKREKRESDALTLEDISAMKYTWRVIQETLRIQPPVGFSFRKAITDIEYTGYSIPKGWKLMWSTQQSHYDPRFFKDPLTFDPSRWEQPPTPFTFVAFGGGPRKCPGYEFAKMEMLVFVHHLVRRYEWSLVDPDERIIRDPLPRTPKNIPIRITKITSF